MKRYEGQQVGVYNPGSPRHGALVTYRPGMSPLLAYQVRQCDAHFNTVGSCDGCPNHSPETTTCQLAETKR